MLKPLVLIVKKNKLPQYQSETASSNRLDKQITAETASSNR